MKAGFKQETNNVMTRNELNTNLRVIQVHPSLRCNLMCKHCYSSSEPAKKENLYVDDIIQFLKYTRNYGFEILSVSGGEPFLYPQLETLLIESHSIGNKNITVSNGMLFKTEKAKRILSHLDLIAISIDGEPNFHDEMRSLNGAFKKMEEGIQVLKDMNINFGLIHTLTEQSWQKLLWLADFAYAKGAKLLQLHPLELTGRAALNFKHFVPTQESLHKIFIICNYLEEKYIQKMKIQIDFLHKQNIIHSPEIINFYGDDFNVNEDNFCDVVKCLIVDENGNVYPMSYGFDKEFCLGNISEIKNGKDIIKRFINNKGRELYSLISESYLQIKNNVEDDLIIWTERIVRNSHLLKTVSLAEEAI